MTKQTQAVLQEVLELPPIERAEMVEQILASFEFPARTEIVQAWAVEVEERLDAHGAGKITSVSAQKVFAKLAQPRRG